MYKYHNIHSLLLGGPSKGILWGRLKEIYLHYTTINACSEDVAASNSPPLLSMSILVLIYYLYFTQVASGQ